MLLCSTVRVIQLSVFRGCYRRNRGVEIAPTVVCRDSEIPPTGELNASGSTVGFVFSINLPVQSHVLEIPAGSERLDALHHRYA